MYACFIPHADKVWKLYITLYLPFNLKLLSQTCLFKDSPQVSALTFFFIKVFLANGFYEDFV